MDDVTLDRRGLEAISAAVAGLVQPVAAELKIPEPNTDFGRVMEALAGQLAGVMTGKAAFAVTHGTAEQEPELIVTADGRGEIHYQALPVGPELPPFVDALRLLGDPGSDLTAATVEGPLALDVFISPDCPNCPRSVRAAVTVAAAGPRAVVRVIDVSGFPQRAASAGVRSVPMIVADNGLTLVGAIDVDALVQQITAARGGDGDGLVFGSLVDAGRFSEAATLLSSEGARRTFLDRWSTSALEGRIGLALTADAALEDRADALDRLVPELLSLLDSDSAPLRGDSADLLGRIGHPSARSALEALLDDDNEDVAEIAADALDELRTAAGEA